MRWVMGVAYEGTQFSGWQRQTQARSIQETLEIALAKVMDFPVITYCAGRTDAGVHASAQVVHFDQPVNCQKKKRLASSILLGTNSLLPANIVVTFVAPTQENFHARFSALSRTYCYILLNTSIRSSLLANKVTWYRYPLDAEKMHLAAQYLTGEHDFSAFRSAQCNSATPFRNIKAISVKRYGKFVMLEITANAFLHHMVRAIMGTLLRVGDGRKSPASVEEVLLSKDRSAAGATAPPEGLYLTGVRYPEKYGIIMQAGKNGTASISDIIGF
jgi:tRNA pseudouridine38-40 synthase